MSSTIVLRGRAIVLFLPEPEPDSVVALRRQFDPLFGRIRAHVTLVFPFESDLSPRGLRDHVVEVAQGFGPIKVLLTDVTGANDLNSPDLRYLFLNVTRGDDVIIELHDRLYTGPLASHLSREFTYVPHVTVGRVTGAHAFDAALERARVTPIDVEATLDTITVYDAAIDAVQSAVVLAS